MGDVEYGPGEQLCLAIAHELAHCRVGAEETAALVLNFDLPHAANIEHGAERRFALAQRRSALLQLRHQRIDFGDGRSARRQRSALASSDRSPSGLADRTRDNPAQPQGRPNHQRNREQRHHTEGPPLRSNRSFEQGLDRKSTRLNSSHLGISYAVFCLKKKNKPRPSRAGLPLLLWPGALGLSVPPARAALMNASGASWSPTRSASDSGDR